MHSVQVGAERYWEELAARGDGEAPKRDAAREGDLVAARGRRRVAAAVGRCEGVNSGDCG